MRKHVAIVGRFLFLAFALVDASPGVAGTIKVDCDTGNALGTALANLRPGDVVLLHGTCKENVVIQPEVQHRHWRHFRHRDQQRSNGGH